MIFFIILTLIIVLLIIYFIGNNYKEIYQHGKNIHSMPVDIVITWVDFNEKLIDEMKAQHNFNEYFENTSDEELTQRFKSNNEIHYCLKLIIKNIKWYNNIFIVIKDEHQQLPFTKDFMKTNSIYTVYHKEIIPKEYLPTFSSPVIENHLHRIKNLHEYYIYFNDDTFVIKNISKNDLIDPKGNPYITYNKSNLKHIDRLHNLNYIRMSKFKPKNFDMLNIIKKAEINTYKIMKNPNYKLINKLICHHPSMCRKSYDEFIYNILIKKYPKTFNKGCSNSFRNRDMFLLNRLLRPYYYEKEFGCTWEDIKSDYINSDNEASFLNSNIIFACCNELDEDLLTSEKYNNLRKLLDNQ